MAKNINIFVLHPNNRISPVQRKLMTIGKEKNVFNIAINGNFDDCQNLVKSMFSDKEFSTSINMSGVNSINWARIIAQSVYYFYAYVKVGNGQPLSFSVPTGNFGDIYAGYLAKKLGLPIDKLIVATNKNDILHRAISGGDYTQKKVEETNTPSMDIQIASNFERLIYDLNNGDDTETIKVMNDIKEKGKYIIDQEKLNKINTNFLSSKMSEDEVSKIRRKNIFACVEYYSKKLKRVEMACALTVNAERELEILYANAFARLLLLLSLRCAKSRKQHLCY